VMTVSPHQQRDSSGSAHVRARRRAEPWTLLVCLLASLGLNYGGLLASLVLFNSGEPRPVMTRVKVCVDGQTRSERLIEAALSGENIELLRGVEQLLIDDCESQPVMIALVDDKPEERDPLDELMPEPEPDKPRE
jgi:hypothetical protein